MRIIIYNTWSNIPRPFVVWSDKNFALREGGKTIVFTIRVQFAFQKWEGRKRATMAPLKSSDIATSPAFYEVNSAM